MGASAAVAMNRGYNWYTTKPLSANTNICIGMGVQTGPGKSSRGPERGLMRASDCWLYLSKPVGAAAACLENLLLTSRLSVVQLCGAMLLGTSSAAKRWSVRGERPCPMHQREARREREEISRLHMGHSHTPKVCSRSPCFL